MLLEDTLQDDALVDDDLLNVPPGLNSFAYYSRPETKARIREIMGSCQCFLTPSPMTAISLAS